MKKKILHKRIALTQIEELKQIKKLGCAKHKLPISNAQAAIIAELQKDARIGFSEISRKHKIPVTTVFDNYRSLAHDGFMKKYTCIIDFARLGYSYRSFIFLKSAKKDLLIDYLNKSSSVNSLFRISEYDLLVDCVFTGMKEFYDMMESLSNFEITGLEHHDFLETVKIEGLEIF
jgi:DNA-binding Lrp family transcriptional regulator